MNEDFGTIEHNGLKVILDEKPVQTSRMMSEYCSNLLCDSDTYIDEFAAYGHTENGEKVRVFWASIRWVEKAR